MPLAGLRAALSLCWRVFAATASIAFALALGPTPALPAPIKASSLVGEYDGQQMEIAAGLELTANGRFRYALSYGGLDEEAAGKWTLSGDRVLLVSDPVDPPRFVLLSQSKGAEGVLRLSLDVPDGMSRQYFNAIILTAKGETENEQFAEDGLTWPFAPDDPPTSVRIVLPIYEIAGEPLKLDAEVGYSANFRFEPHDLGKVDFQNAPLKIENGELVLERYGRTIRFRRVKP